MIRARLAGDESIIVEAPEQLDDFNAQTSRRLPCPIARGELALANLPLVHLIAGRFARLRTSHTFGDLVGYGLVGLLEAADAFDPDRGVKFGAFASRYVRGRIISAIRYRGFVVRASRRRGADVGSLDGVQTADVGARRAIERLETADAAGTCLGALSLSRPRVVARVYGIGQPPERQADIARARGTTKQAIGGQIYLSFAELRERYADQLGESA